MNSINYFNTFPIAVTPNVPVVQPNSNFKDEECIHNLCSLKKNPSISSKGVPKKRSYTRRNKGNASQKSLMVATLTNFNNSPKSGFSVNSLLNLADQRITTPHECNDDQCCLRDVDPVVVGTHANPFPNLKYKIESALVKMNANGVFNCPIDGCDKIIKGNKGNVSSHLRYHMKYMLEDNQETGNEKLYLSKGKVRGKILNEQMVKYGATAFRKDSHGRYVCFFENCNCRMLTNFSRHVQTHEKSNHSVQKNISLVIKHKPSVDWVYHYPSSPTNINNTN